MNLDFWFSGIPDELGPLLFVSRYLFFLMLFNCISGMVVCKIVENQKMFYLIRQGYKMWCLSVLSKSIFAVFTSFSVLVMFSIITHPDTIRTIIISSIVYVLNILTLTAAQSMLIMLSSSAMTGFFPVTMVQFISVFLSRHLPSAWKLILPGNWGMIIRSHVNNSNGFSLAWAIIIEISILFLILLGGWRIIRWHDRKGGLK